MIINRKELEGKLKIEGKITDKVSNFSYFAHLISNDDINIRLQKCIKMSCINKSQFGKSMKTETNT
jgi:hypothetical protein